jgi:hypothetical protein
LASHVLGFLGNTYLK